VLAPDREDAALLRATDGETLGTRKIARTQQTFMLPNGQQRKVFSQLEDSCLAMFGRNLLLWKQDYQPLASSFLFWKQNEGRFNSLNLYDPLEGKNLWPEHKFAQGSHACVLGEKVAGVMEPNGRFVLISLPDGKTIADQKLKEESNRMDITLLESEGNYYLITNSFPAAGNQGNIQPMPGNPYNKPIFRGLLYSFTPDGKLRWPAPVSLANQFLISNQPSQLPVITFASQHFIQNLGGGGNFKASILCIDKRTGLKVFKSSLKNQYGFFNVSGDAKKKTVDLTLPQTTVTLTFTDKPVIVAADNKAKSVKSTPQTKAVRDLWNGIQQTFGLDSDESDSDD
jgi:hypothetical protein